MARRNRKQGDAEISSDSFLDIIANIVGILIILIVVAGMRVSQAPIFQDAPEEEAVIQDEQNLYEPAPPMIVGTTDAELWSPPQQPEAEPMIPADPVIIDVTEEPDPALFVRYERQQTERKSLQTQLAALKSRLSKEERQSLDAEAKLASVRAELKSLDAELKTIKSSYETAKESLSEKSETVSENRNDIERLMSLLKSEEAEEQQLAETRQPEAEVLRHDMTPVSQFVKEKEIHFLISNNTIAAVPLEELLERLKDRIRSKQSWLLRANSHSGELGPIRGFRMQYLVEKEQQSQFDQLRSGNTQIRIVLSKFALVPDEETIIRETIPQATSSTSRYLIAVRSASPGTTCTFWVHPDSFETYQKLKKYAHESNLRVAGRPLPQGMPITGSPSGSHSAAQ
ncbi:MAG: hypothetical protein HUJ26_04300 [Planctomycetaceae bacterium]|nr:hypothetical protein [Planctomycetaceae bacterium]